MNNILVVLLIAHTLGDYYFQNENMAVRKSRQYKGVIIHSFIYLLIMLAFMIPFMNVGSIVAGAIAGSLHFLIDTGKFLLSGLGKSKNPKVQNQVNSMKKSGQLYAIDQLFHIITLWVVSRVYLYSFGLPVLPIFIGENYITILYQRLSLILGALILLKPTNITFKKMFGSIKPVKNEEINYLGEQSAGRLIGNMERLLILMLLMQNQFGAIGLVFTAKSITRYNKIVEDKQFGEYYLLGTLFSLLATIVVYALVIV